MNRMIISDKTERKLKEAVIGWIITMAILTVLDILIIRQPIAWEFNILISVGSGIVWYFTTRPKPVNSPPSDIPDMR